MTQQDPRLSMNAYARVYDLYPEAIEADFASLALDMHEDRMVAALQSGDEDGARVLLVEQIPLLLDKLTHVRALARRMESLDRIEWCDWLTGELNQLVGLISRAQGGEPSVG